MGFGNDDTEKSSNRHSGHCFTRQMINIMTQKAYLHCIDNSSSEKVCIVDVGAQYTRSSGIFRKCRTPKFNDYFSKLLSGYGD